MANLNSNRCASSARRRHSSVSPAPLTTREVSGCKNNSATLSPSPCRTKLRNRFRAKRYFVIGIWTLIVTFYGLGSSSGNGPTSVQAVNPPSTTTHIPSLNDGNSDLQDPNYESLEGEPFDPIDSDPIEENSSGVPSSDGGKRKPGKKFQGSRAKKYGEWEVPGVNCTPPGIDDFPEDLFTPQQRQQGYVVVHFIVSMYIFYALALVCDDYFVPSMECICEEMKLPSDVAGATFMAIATSAPELFTNLIGTFITHGDIGIGAIVGSAVFNILAVVAVCGLGAGMVIKLEWYSITRDCLFYSLSVLLLIAVLRDERIYWYEALVLITVYALYIFGMHHNTQLKRRAEKIVYKAKRRWKRNHNSSVPTKPVYPLKNLENGEDGELEKFQPANGDTSFNRVAEEEHRIEVAVDTYNDEYEAKELEVVHEALKNEAEYAEEEKDEFSLFKFPKGRGCRTWFEWFLSWPIRLVFTFSIPDCRQPRWRRWFPLTFIMCIIWIGVLSYVVNWMMTIIGHTLKIPDSVMGLTFIAAGTSIPEVVSSLIVSRQGLGTMALSNSIGSNTFDILMCLGLPWLIQASILAQDPIEPYIQINSLGLEYSTMMLITSLVLLYVILVANKYVLDRKIGFISLFLYCVFLLMASLFELNVFFIVNLPTCIHHED